MKSWPVKPLGELGDLKGGGTPSRKVPEYFRGDIPWITGADVTDLYVRKAREFITRDAIENSATTLLPKNTVLVVSRTGVGKIGIAATPLCTSQDLTGIICNDSVFPEYLARCLLARADFLTRAAQGATIKGITREFLSRVEIPVPPLAEQERVVKLLDEADALRELRAQADHRADALIPAIFNEMFGDPTENPRNWKREPFGALLDRIDSGWSPVCHDRPAQPDEWGVLKLGAVTTCQYLDTQTKALPENIAPRPELEVKQGDLIFSRKNTYNLVAACVFVFATRPKLTLSDLLFRFRLKPGVEINPLFLWGLLTVPNKRKQVQALASGSAGSMPNIFGSTGISG